MKFTAATKRYQNEVRLGDNKLLNYKAGKPFSDKKITNADSDQAGLMVAWNNVMRWQHYGYSANITTAYIRPSAPGKSGRLLKGMKGSGDVLETQPPFIKEYIFQAWLQNQTKVNFV